MEKDSNIKLDKPERTIYNSSNPFNNYPINSSHSYQFKLFISIILEIIGIYLFLYNGGNNCHKKYLNNKKTMKHAILLLSSYGINYMNTFLSQFNNDKRFEIYIHIDGKSKSDIENNKTITKSNIIYIKHLFKSKKYSTEMVDVMLELLNISNKKDIYDYFHYFSDSCYLIKTLDEFYDFFIKNNNKSYMTYHLAKFFLYKNQSSILFKGSQWMSLHSNIVYKLLDNINLFHKYKDEIKNKTIKILLGAPDEFIIQHIIINDICKGKPNECNVINNNLRFIRWRRKVGKTPNYLDIDNVSEEEIKNITKENYLFIRKIDYKNYKSIDLINRLKG